MEGVQKPSIGRIVVYNHPGSADGKFPPTQSPAMVQRVNEDETVDIVVFSHFNGFFFNKNVVMGAGPRQYNWPQRVWVSAGLTALVGQRKYVGSSKLQKTRGNLKPVNGKSYIVARRMTLTASRIAWVIVKHVELR